MLKKIIQYFKNIRNLSQSPFPKMEGKNPNA